MLPVLLWVWGEDLGKGSWTAECGTCPVLGCETSAEALKEESAPEGTFFELFGGWQRFKNAFLFK